jgi:valyl-tRNA synthetase
VARRALRADEATVRRLARISAISLEATDAAQQSAGHAVLADGTTVSVPLGDLIDIARECGRLGAERDRLLGLIAGQAAKLANEQFVARAPAAVVAREREKLASWQEQVEILRQKRQQLGCPE